MSGEREIPQRELRNSVAEVLRHVAGGGRFRITVRGRPVADLVPVSDRPSFVPRSEVERVTVEAPLDNGFLADVDAVVGSSIADL
jgi:prevent-host-death family protein